MGDMNLDNPGAADQSLLVIIPTYNEAGNIEAIVEKTLRQEGNPHILVVDDGSPDGTAELVARFAKVNSRVHLLKRHEKSGLGRSYVAGFEWGLGRGYARFVEMDADFSHDPDQIPQLVRATSENGLAIGSRYVAGGKTLGWSKRRKLLSRGGNLYSSLLLGFPFKDSTSGFRCYRKEVLEAIDLEGVLSNGYAFQIDMTYKAWRLGFPITEVPILFKEREVGDSKMNGAIVREAVLSVARWAIRDRIFRRKPPTR
jgi:dolichol-phosphate mannosyltransferase